MTTATETATQEAQKIWNQLDADENNTSPTAPAVPEPVVTAPVVVEDPPADKADDKSSPAPGEQLLMDKVNGLESQLSQALARLRNAEGHIGGLTSQLKQQLQAAQQTAANGSDAPSASEIRAAQGSAEKMAALRRDYPEFADAIDSVLNERVGHLERKIAEARQQSAATEPVVTAQDISQLRSELLVESRHPGWQQRVQQPEFGGWLKRQPREVQLLADSRDPQDAVRLLDLHNEAVKPKPNNKNLDAAAALPSGRPGAATRQKSLDDMTPDELWAYYDQVDRQKQKQGN